MSQVIEILSSLGIDSTVYIQFAIFFVAFISMKYIVFNPYLKAYEERQNRTVGSEKDAKKLTEQAAENEKLFAKKAKLLNSEISQIFNEKNEKAKKETEEILKEAAKKSEEETEKARVELADSVSAVRKNLEDHIPEISQDIQSKFVKM